MKKSKWITSIALLLMACSYLAQAQVTDSKSEDKEQSAGPPPYPGKQEKWKYKFYGFSPDLTTTAFEQTGPDDYNWSALEFYVVNVNKNDFSTKPIRDRFEDELPDSVTKLILNRLTRFKLPVNIGFVKYELNPDKQEFNINIKGAKYKLKLMQTDMGENKIFELQLIGLSDGKIRVLQKDSKLPASRGSVKRYRLKDAYVQGSKLAVMLEMDMESYEMESYWYYPTKYMMITGSLENLPIN